MNWPTPRNVTYVRYFMGLVGYYVRFIEGFSKTTHSINSLQKKGIKFEWTSRCEESFQQLKSLLTSAPVLKVADPENDFGRYFPIFFQNRGIVSYGMNEHAMTWFH